VASFGDALPLSDFVFAEIDGPPRGPRAFSAEWADCATSIEMPDVAFRALRHTHTSQPIDAGVDIATISERLGHANPMATQVPINIERDVPNY
jgi:integrase